MPRSQAEDTQRTTTATDHYETLYRNFHWQVPAVFNIAEQCCARWAKRTKTRNNVAIVAYSTLGKTVTHSFAVLQSAANRLSNALVAQGVRRGDRVAIVLPQRFETAVAYIAVLQLGAVAVPLSQLFGPEALEYRLQNSDAVLALGDDSTLPNLLEVRGACTALRCIIGVEQLTGDLGFTTALAAEKDVFIAAKTKADEAAVLIYTSGTTGPPKGALIPHRALLGNLSGFVCSHNWFGFNGIDNLESNAVFWSPADWAWTGGLMDALLPALYFGRPIVAYNGRFQPEIAFELMQSQGITHTFLFPTALKAMMKAVPQPRKKYAKLCLQSIMSAGEAVGDAVFAYCQNQLDVTVNEMFGQTEINYIVGNCSKLWPAKANSMGKGYPGHRVAVIDEAGKECPVGMPGDVALHRYDMHGHPDPIFFLGYWKNDTATQDKYSGDWCRTGDLASRDADGYLWYQGRADDVFKAAGYRIGPSEIENCLVKHPAVANAAVVPKPDTQRGAVVKAYVVLAPQAVQKRAQHNAALYDAALIAELQAHVKGRLAPYEYPKEIEFINELPMTTTGKVQRRVLRLQEEARAKWK